MCCDDADTIRGRVYFRADIINFKPWKTVGTIQGRGRENVTCTIIAAITITIDAHMVTSGSHGRHYLRADTTPLSQYGYYTIQRADTIQGNTVTTTRYTVDT